MGGAQAGSGTGSRGGVHENESTYMNKEEAVGTTGTTGHDTTSTSPPQQQQLMRYPVLRKNVRILDGSFDQAALSIVSCAYLLTSNAFLLWLLHKTGDPNDSVKSCSERRASPETSPFILCPTTV